MTDAHRTLIKILAAQAVEQFCNETDNSQLIETVTHHKERPRLDSSRDNQEWPR